MFAPNRRQERKPHIIELLKRNMNHRKVVDFTFWENEGEYLEGTGSMVFDRRKKIAYCCRSPRTSEKVLADFCSRMNFQPRSEEHTSELQSRPHLVCRLLLEKK